VGAGRRIAVRAAVLAAAAALLAAAVLAGMRLAGARRDQRSLQEQIGEIDELSARGFLAKAEALLRAASTLAASEQDWLRLLKRARALAAATGDFKAMAALSLKAAAAIPGSRPLARLQLYAQLRAGQAPEPRAPRTLSSDPDLQCLLAEAAALRQGPPPEGLSPELQELLAARLEPKPESLQALAARWHEEALLRDAGLAWMKAGDTTRAAAAFRELPEDPTARELRLGAAYDAGAWEDALRLIEQIQPEPELSLVRADLLLLLGRDREAAGLYQELIARDPRFFWSPYLNLAGILADQGEADAAVELYRRASELFPDSEAAATALMASLARAGQREAALEVLKRSLPKNPDSLALRWMLLELGRGEASDQRYQAGLRALYAEHPRSSPLAQTLSAQLLGLSDAAGAWAVLEEYQGPADEPWLLEARGLAKALEEDLPAAADLLQRCLQAGGDGRARCNLAVVLAAQGETEAAVKELLEACGQLSGRPRTESQARALLAENLLTLGNRAAARREGAYALQLDPGNGRALLLLRTLEGE
jgi:tetratricopeptide (TPR) repeat protein